MLRLAAGRLGHHVADRGLLADELNLQTEKRFAAEHHLETVIVRRVVAAGDHDGAVGRQRGRGEIQHRRRTTADAQNLHAARHQARHELRLEFRRRQAAIVAHRDARSSAGRHDAAEHPANRERIRAMQRFADNTADVVLAQRRGVEAMPEFGHYAVS